MITWNTITNLGDATVMALAAAAIALGLIAQRAWRIAFWWCLFLALATILVVVTKVAFIGWGIGICQLDFKGVSGHSMRATAIIPVMCYLIFHKSPALARMYGMWLGIALAAIVIVSRLALHAHSASEVVAGGLLGIVISLSIVEMLRTAPKLEFPGSFLAFLMLVLVLGPNAEPTATQPMMIDLALYLSNQQEPFNGDQWKSPAPDHVCRFVRHATEYSTKRNLSPDFDVRQVWFSSGG